MISTHFSMGILGVVCVGLLVAVARSRIAAPFILAFALLFLIPGLVGALGVPNLVPALASASMPLWERSFFQGIFLAPACLMPIGIELQRVPSNLTRAAMGLGATRKARLRLIWLPLLGPAALLSIAVTALLLTLCLYT